MCNYDLESGVRLGVSLFGGSPKWGCEDIGSIVENLGFEWTAPEYSILLGWQTLCSQSPDGTLNRSHWLGLCNEMEEAAYAKIRTLVGLYR